MSIELPEQLKNPYVLGGLAVVFVLVFLATRGGGGSAAAGLDPNAALAVSTNAQLAQYAIQGQTVASNNNTQLAIAAATANSTLNSNLLSSITANFANLANVQQSAQASDTANFNSTIKAYTDANNNAISVQLAQDQLIANETASNNAAYVSTFQAQASQNIATINAQAQMNIATANAQTSQTNGILGLAAKALPVAAGL